MSLTRVERTSEDLARELLPCPECGSQPEIVMKSGELPIPWSNQISIHCRACFPVYDDGKPIPPTWHKSLYEAVSVWQVSAKLKGSVEPDNDGGPF